MKKETIEAKPKLAWTRHVQGYYSPGEYGNYKGNQKFDRYDIELFDGNIILDCYPNNGTFITRCCKIIEEYRVKNTRMVPRPNGTMKEDKVRAKVTECVEKSRRRCHNCQGEVACGLDKVMNKIYKHMAGGDKEIYFADITQGMYNIKAQLELSLTTGELFRDTFFLYKMHDTKKCAIYKWCGDHLYRVDNS